MNPIEKILWGLFILMSLGALGWGIVIGLPSTYPASAMHSEKIPEQQWRAQLTIEQRTELDQMLVSGGSGGSTGGSTRRPQSEIYRINKPLLERMGNLNECRRELMNASSEVQEDGSLKIFGILPESLLAKVGLRENDVLRSVNGVPLDFGSLGDCLDAHGKSLEKLRAGDPVVILIERRGTPVALTIDPPGL